MKRFKKQFLGVLFIVVGLLVSGCVSNSGHFANLRVDNEVKTEFESYKVDPQYNYFYFGSETFPKAFIGLAKNIALVSNLWKPIDLTPDVLHKWIWVHANRYSWKLGDHGSRIVTKQGRKIGVWYSLEGWQQWGRIELLTEDQIRVGSPVGGQDGKIMKRYGRLNF